MIKVQSVSSKIKVACFLPFLITTQGCITLPIGFNAEKPADTSAISTKNNKIQPLSPGAGSMKGAQNRIPSDHAGRSDCRKLSKGSPLPGK